jgi:hypothetical protein
MSVDTAKSARRLDAGVIIEGSVRKAGEKLRITVQAIQAESGHDLWSEVFRRKLKDVFCDSRRDSAIHCGLDPLSANDCGRLTFSTLNSSCASI